MVKDHSDSERERNVLFNDALNTFYVRLYGVRHMVKDILIAREREMFYLTTHSTHFIYGYMTSDIWLRTILIARERNVLFNDALNTFYVRLYGVRHMVKDHSDSEKGERERNVLFNDALNTFYVRLYDVRRMVKSHSDCDRGEREREMFYLTTHSTHFIYGYMASDIWLRTILIVRKETRCRHIGYSYRLTERVLLYAPSHR